MAASSKEIAFRLRQIGFWLCVLKAAIVLIIVMQPVHSYNQSLSEDLSLEENDKNSVKKELRNPDRWPGSGLTEEEEVEPIRGTYMDDAAKIFASFLRTVSNEELGVTALQSIYDSLPFGIYDKEDSSRVRELSERLQGKLNRYLSSLNFSRTSIEELFWHHLHRPLNNPFSCCDVPDSLLRYNGHFGTLVSEDFACDVLVQNKLFLPFVPGHNLTEVFSRNAKLLPTIKWQYFLGLEGGLNEYPSHRFDSRSSCKPVDTTRRRELYLAAIFPQPKSVVIVIDHGSALSTNQLNIAKALGKYFISTLSEKDRVGLIALADEPHYAGMTNCYSKNLVRANHENKLRFHRFIDSLSKAKAPANHVLGFRHALDMARRATLDGKSTSMNGCWSNVSCSWNTSFGECPMDNRNQILLIYISRGLLSSLAEPRQVMELIALGQMCLQGKLVINTYTLIDDGKPIMYEKAFLQDVALQNYSRYNVSFASLDKMPIVRGQAMSINATRMLSPTVGNYFSVLNASTPTHENPTYSTPYWDPVGKGMVVSITQPCFHLDHLIGAVGLDIHLADLVEDITYFNQPGGRSYAFMIDSSGTTIMHPSLLRPNAVQEEPISTDIGLLESKTGFNIVRSKMLSMSRGSHNLLYNLEKNISATYTWESVANSPYIMCIVTVEKSAEIRSLKRVVNPSTPDLVYHRLDLVSSPTKVDVCRYFRQTATLDAGSLYLSPSCFLSSFKFESWGEQSPVVVQSFMAFLNDKTKLIANPGLKVGIRSDVAALTQLASYWKGQFTNSALSQFIVRRYVATPSGVLHEYPGSVRESSFDPIRRPWFQKAMEFPGRVVITGPYLDHGGSGYIISVSHTVYEGRPAALHGPNDDVVAVLGADFTLAYFHRLLWETLPFCPDRTTIVSGSNIRCFLMDDRGYLVAHPRLLEPDVNGAVEMQHLTHHEPLVASDLLNHNSFVLKRACHSYFDRTIQRFYQLNLTLSSGLADRTGESGRPVPVLTNLVHGEHCIRYQIVGIPGTNLFVGVVNQTCETATAFCPCSTVDRLCLNCHRMEQSECECPCECPLELEPCNAPSLRDPDWLPTCPAQSEIDRLPLYSPPRDVGVLPVCLALDCEERVTERECFGVVGCEWCVRDTDSHTPLQVPFCTQQEKCYAGILRGPSPYSDGSNSAPPSDNLSSFKAMPVGPVAGGVMTFFFFVALLVYCYRQHSRRHDTVQYGAGSGETVGLRMSQLDNEHEDPEIEPDDAETAAVVSHEFSLAGLDNVAIVSPYRVNTGYRRPAGGDSDHGYSTMTPHEDSEHTTSYVEPLLIGRDRYRPTVRSTSGASLSSRASSPMGPIYSRANQRIESPGTLHESADELELSSPRTESESKWRSDLETKLYSARNGEIGSYDNHSLPTGMTVINEPLSNQIIVPVTVHMVDTT